MTFGTAIFIEGNITHMDDHVDAVFIFTFLQHNEKKDLAHNIFVYFNISTHYFIQR